MTWFAANVILWARNKPDSDEPEPDGPCRAWESVVLVKAQDPDEAIRKASEYGEADAAENSAAYESEGAGAEMVFMGVRKLRELELSKPDSLDRAADLAEISVSEMEVANKADLLNLARGGPVIVRYIS